jgi:pilus assembly protein CpaE
MSDVVISGLTEADAKAIRAAVGRGESVVDLDGQDLAAEVALLQPLAVVLGSGVKGGDQFEACQGLTDADPTLGVLIVDTPSEETMARALEAGARAVLPPGSTAAQARKAVERVLSGSRRLRDHRVTVDSVHRTIVVVSAKGGAGKTMLSVNLAVALSLAERRRTVLVDLDLQFGDIGSALLLTPDHTIVDAAEAVHGEGRKSAIKVFLTRHGPSDLFTLCGCDNPAAGEEIKPQDVAAIVDELSEEFRYLIVDTPAGLGEATLAALERATDIVVLVDLDVASVRGGRKLIETLDLIGMKGARRHIVLNRSNSKVALDIDEVEVVLGSPADVFLPSSRAVPLSLNRGQPLVMTRPRHAYSKGVAELASRLLGGGGRRSSS